MTEERARRFEIKLWIGGHDATDYTTPYLKELTYTDSADGEADDLQFTLHDRDGHWCSDWRPSRGTKVKCTAVCKSWEEPGKDLKLLCGEFTIDEIEYSGPPTQVRIKALTSAMTTGLRDSRKNRAWKNSSFRAIADQIAQEHNLELQYDGDPCSFERKDQRSDSDLGFLNRQCRENGFHCKVHDGKLVIRDGRKAEMQEAVLAIPMKGSMYSPTSWSFKTSSSDTGYTEAKSVYTDPKQGKTHTAIVEADRSGEEPDDADKSITLDSRTESPADAARKAKAKLQEKNEKENTCSIDILGYPKLYAGQVISLTGFGVFAGNFLVKKATHKFSSSGYTTSLELSKCRSREDRVLVAKSVEVTSRSGVAAQQAEPKNKNTDVELSSWEQMFSNAVFCIRKSRGEELSDAEKTILCLPDIAEAMAEKQASEKDRQGWLYLKTMFERWIGHKTRIGPSGSTPMWLDWDWLMQFERAKNLYQKLTINKGPEDNISNDVTNAAAFESLGKILKRHGYITSQIEKFDFTQIDWPGWGEFYHQGCPIPGSDVSLSVRDVDGLEACMGGFTLRALAGGYVEPLPDGRHRIHMQKCAVYAYDAFQFEDDGWLKEKIIGLGSWNCQKLHFSKNPLGDGIYLNNGVFRQFRAKNDFGGDFYVFTVLHQVENFRERIYELYL